MSQPVENPKFSSLPLWQSMLVFTSAIVLGFLIVVAMRELLGWPIPTWVGGGIGGTLGVIAAQAVARRRARQS